MSCHELMKSLREEERENVDRLWSDARSAAEQAHREADQQIESRRQAFRKIHEERTAEEEKNIITAAERDARTILLHALHDLSQRLYSLAASMLPGLMQRRSSEVFCSMADELPQRRWECIRVNPRDVETAGKRFPDAEILPDSTLAGGLQACCDKGGICVINTIEKRLETAWEEILPQILHEAGTGATNHEPLIRA